MCENDCVAGSSISWHHLLRRTLVLSVRYSTKKDAYRSQNGFD